MLARRASRIFDGELEAVKPKVQYLARHYAPVLKVPPKTATVLEPSRRSRESEAKPPFWTDNLRREIPCHQLTLASSSDYSREILCTRYNPS